MNRFIFILLFGLILLLPLAAEKHPQATELQHYIDQNPIEPRIPEMMIFISQKSEELNSEGYELYLNKRYREAIAKFEEALKYDEDNSFAWYNMACCHALLGESYEASQNLKEAVTRDWFWGLQLMVDTDLDNVRYVGIRYEHGEYRYGNETLFSHYLYEDGRVDFYDNQIYQGGQPLELGSGYYCIIYSVVFEYFPFVDSYMVDGPNGPITTPANYNVVKMPNISLR